MDNFARFAAPGVVMLTWTDGRTDPQWEISNSATRSCRGTDARGQDWQVVKLHQPGPIYITAEEAAGVDHICRATAGRKVSAWPVHT